MGHPVLYLVWGPQSFERGPNVPSWDSQLVELEKAECFLVEQKMNCKQFYISCKAGHKAWWKIGLCALNLQWLVKTYVEHEPV